MDFSGISNFIVVTDFWFSEALTKKRNVPTLDGDDLDTDSDPGSVRPNLMELVTNARSENPQTQLDAIQCKNNFHRATTIFFFQLLVNCYRPTVIHQLMI